jgi:hypothetical protein
MADTRAAATAPLLSPLLPSPQYEVGNQDHSLMLGVEAADNILFGTQEVTLHHPDIVNAGKDTSLAYSRGAGSSGGSKACSSLERM